MLVLATLVLVTSACVILARLGSTAALHTNAARAVALADDLLVPAEDVILDWLAAHSESVVLAPDATLPAVEVLHDAWCAHDLEVEMRITAWDQRGMVPIAVARTASPLRAAVPFEVLRVIDSLAPQESSDPSAGARGLDQLRADASRDDGVPIFPIVAAQGEPVRFGDDMVDNSPTAAADSARTDAAAVGALIATHPSGHTAVNVNTAPLGLVEAALRVAGRGGIEQVIASREAGKLATITAITGRGEESFGLLRSSDCWAFRVDINVRRRSGHGVAGGVQRSWWTIFAKNRAQWERVQRLVIRD